MAVKVLGADASGDMATVAAGVRYAVVDDVLERLRNAGVRNVVLGARPDGPGGA